MHRGEKHDDIPPPPSLPDGFIGRPVRNLDCYMQVGARKMLKRTTFLGVVNCWVCGKPGHISRDCPSRPSPAATSSVAVASASQGTQLPRYVPQEAYVSPASNNKQNWITTVKTRGDVMNGDPGVTPYLISAQGDSPSFFPPGRPSDKTTVDVSPPPSLACPVIRDASNIVLNTNGDGDLLIDIGAQDGTIGLQAFMCMNSGISPCSGRSAMSTSAGSADAPR